MTFSLPLSPSLPTSVAAGAFLLAASGADTSLHSGDPGGDSKGAPPAWKSSSGRALPCPLQFCSAAPLGPLTAAVSSCQQLLWLGASPATQACLPFVVFLSLLGPHSLVPHGIMGVHAAPPRSRAACSPVLFPSVTESRADTQSGDRRLGGGWSKPAWQVRDETL